MVLSFVLIQNRQYVPRTRAQRFRYTRLISVGARPGWRSGMRHTMYVLVLLPSQTPSLTRLLKDEEKVKLKGEVCHRFMHPLTLPPHDAWP